MNTNTNSTPEKKDDLYRYTIKEWLKQNDNFKEIAEKSIYISENGGFELSHSLMTNIDHNEYNVTNNEKDNKNDNTKDIESLYHLSSKYINKNIKERNEEYVKRYRSKSKYTNKGIREKSKEYIKKIKYSILSILLKTSDIMTLQHNSTQNNMLISPKSIIRRRLIEKFLKPTYIIIFNIIYKIKNIFNITSISICTTNKKINIKQHTNINNLVKNSQGELAPIFSFKTIEHGNRYVLSSSPTITLTKEEWLDSMLLAMRDTNHMFLFNMVFDDGKKILDWSNNMGILNTGGETIISYKIPSTNSQITLREKLENDNRLIELQESIHFKHYEIEITDDNDITTRKKLTIPIVKDFLDYIYIEKDKIDKLYTSIKYVSEMIQKINNTNNITIGAICKRANNRSQLILHTFETKNILSEILEELISKDPDITEESFTSQIKGLKEPIIMLAINRICKETKSTLYSQIDLLCNFLPKIAHDIYQEKNASQKPKHTMQNTVKKTTYITKMQNNNTQQSENKL